MVNHDISWLLLCPPEQEQKVSRAGVGCCLVNLVQGRWLNSEYSLEITKLYISRADTAAVVPVLSTYGCNYGLSGTVARPVTPGSSSSRASPTATSTGYSDHGGKHTLVLRDSLHHKSITKLTRLVAGGPREDRFVDDAFTSLPIVPVCLYGYNNYKPSSSPAVPLCLLFIFTQLTSSTLCIIR